MTVCLEIHFEERVVLSSYERKTVEALIADCRAYDGFDPCLHFDTHLNIDREMPAWHLAWAEASGGILAGAACVFAPSRHEGEISACVAPVFRRHGIFRQLYSGLAAALAASGASSALLVCEGSSKPSASVATRLGAKLDRSEYRMRASREKLEATVPPARVRLVPVAQDDIDEAAKLAAAIFGDQPDDARAFTMAELADQGREQYIARAVEGPVGMVSLAHDEDGYWIHGLGVAPSLRNRGFGAAILDAALVVLVRRGADSANLEVDVDNSAAIALYRSRGFEDETRADYWRLADTRGR